MIGAGFTGLSAALELARKGFRVLVVEADGGPGGLAGSFEVEGQRLEKFYHHWFTNDVYVRQLAEELECADRIVFRPSRTGMYYGGRIFRLSTPKDLLRFSALRFSDRFRLGLLTLRARRVTDWLSLEDVSARDWLISMGGMSLYRTVWQPMLNGKFGDYAPEISAVWIWNKLKLRGGSRNRDGAEMLAYFRGGFAALADTMVDRIRRLGGEVVFDRRVGSAFRDSQALRVTADEADWTCRSALLTVPLPLVPTLLPKNTDAGYLDSLRQIKFLANTCLVLELDRSLSQTYWLNVADPSFPYVGVIEHTNFEPPDSYGGRHVVYLSKYLTESHPLYCMSPKETLEFSIPHLRNMFPEFQPEWILRYNVWKARHSQPIVVKNYSRLIPSVKTPIPGVFLATMAQVYPEDRGTNYAIGYGRRAGGLAAAFLAGRCDEPTVHPHFV